jgi:hypothetical protein
MKYGLHSPRREEANFEKHAEMNEKQLRCVMDLRAVPSMNTNVLVN